MNEAVAADTYALGRSRTETRRLILQARVNEAHTRHLLAMSGVAPGMRVVDLGCGTGDVTALVARLVGPAGSVVGLDSDEAVLAVARRRAAEAGLRNVSFRRAALPDLALDRPVDALVGRLILVHLPDPVAALRSMIRYVVPGGLVSVVEFRTTACRAVPAVPLVDGCVDWCCAALRAAGVDPDFGERLPRVLRDAGLPPLGVSVAGAAGDAGSEVVPYLAMTAASLLPVMEAHGIAGREDVDGLEQRMRRDVRDAGAVVYAPELVCAWATTPARP